MLASSLNLFHAKIPERLTLWLAVRDPLLDPSLQQRFPDMWGGNIWCGGDDFTNCRKNQNSAKQGGEGSGMEIQGMMIPIIFHGSAGDQWDEDS